ncbi:MAG: methyltransferase, partial [Planctomycetes bacterium]|nr:methyltransferase [Planctomycetota bacterium]
EYSAAFSQGGDGFVPGEGVGVVILKPYSQAIKDKDAIYALIRGSAVNHNGRTIGYGLPNLNQQVEVIETAICNSGVDKRSISYIEAAASGSELGDVAEIEALIKVFSKRGETSGNYRIGSVKPNIGHCESASGMSQLTKVLLSLKHKTLLPTLLQGEMNPAIPFERLPFHLQRTAEEWEPIIVDGEALPRRAGISSFGAGGVNAHLIVEEYIPPAREAIEINLSTKKKFLFVLSAKILVSLEDAAKQWITYLEKQPNIDLEALCYTLQNGREAMSYRLAIICDTQSTLVLELTQWLKTKGRTERCYLGNIKKQEKIQPSGIPLATDTIEKLAQAWILGSPISWKEQYRDKTPIKLNQLPTYQFEQKQCWFSSATTLDVVDFNTMKKHPYVYANKAEEFYSLGTFGASSEFQEEYLTFCPFKERRPGFSMTRVFLNPRKYPEEFNYVRLRQIEMRQVLFCKENFNEIHTVLDFGCGHGTDVIQIASLFPHIQAHGFTITRDQANLGNQRITSRNLNSQVKIFHKDSSKDPFPFPYDLIIGIEVSFHIRNKNGLFQNISRSLNENGKILLMDFIANTQGSLLDPNTEISIPTQEEWARLLSKNFLEIDEIINVSPQISNFLYDPDSEENIKDLPKVVQDTYRNYANQSISLENGWFRYVLLKLKKNTQWSQQQIESFNLERIKAPTPYPMALQTMLKQPRIFYPHMDTNEVYLAESIGKQLPDKPSLTEAHHNDSMDDQNLMVQNSFQSSCVSRAVLQQSLLEIFSQELGLKAEEVENAD